MTDELRGHKYAARSLDIVKLNNVYSLATRRHCEQCQDLPAVMDSAVFVMASAVLWMDEGRLSGGRGK